MSRKRTPESGVLKACTDLLNVHKIWFCRMNTGAVKNGARFFRFGKKGMADVLASLATYCGSRCCLPPKDPDDRELWEQRHCLRLNTAILWIECKADKGKQSEDQIAFEKEVSTHGHHYLVVRDVRTLEAWLKEHGAI